MENMNKYKREGFVWNILSSLITAASSVFVLAVVNRFLGIEIGAYYSVAVAVANVLINIGHLNIFGYQISDVKEKYCYREYEILRFFSALLMIIISLIYVMLNKYNTQKALIIFIYCVYRAIYAYIDLYQGRYQQKGRVDLAGKLQFIKVAIPDTILVICIIMTGDILVAINTAIVVEIIVATVYNNLYFKNYKTSLRPKAKNCLSLFVQCVPLFFSAFANTYILNSSKYAIDKILPDEMQVYYSVLLLPSTTIHMLAGFIYRPLLTEYAIMWEKGEVVKLRKGILKILLAAAIITIAIEVLAIPIILPILVLLYDLPELMKFGGTFRILLLAGGINASITFLGFIITILRKQSVLLVIYSITLIVALFLPTAMINKIGIEGAAWAFLFILLLQILFLGIVCYTTLIKRKDFQDNG